MYHSRLINGLLYDALVAEHSQKTVYCFQSTNLRANKQNFEFNTLRKVMDGMKIQEAKYKVVYIHCSDASSSFENAVPISADIEALIDEGHLEVLIARFPYYPKLPIVELQIKK